MGRRQVRLQRCGHLESIGGRRKIAGGHQDIAETEPEKRRAGIDPDRSFDKRQRILDLSPFAEQDAKQGRSIRLILFRGEKGAVTALGGVKLPGAVRAKRLLEKKAGWSSVGKPGNARIGQNMRPDYTERRFFKSSQPTAKDAGRRIRLDI